MCESGNRSNNIRKLGAHASAVVHDKPDGNRSVALFEYREFLRLPVFKDVKIFQLKTGDKRSVRVSHFHGKQDKIRGHLNLPLAIHAGPRTLRRERWREAEDAKKEQQRNKEQVYFVQIMFAGTRSEEHEEAFSQRRT